MVVSDTIFALSSGGLPSGVAVIRISGPACSDALMTMIGRIPAPRHASLCSIRNRNGELLDQGLVLYFPNPASFTGEDSAELHIHGGRATVLATLDALGGIPGLRPAEAGEFSRQAFHNGKLDLVEIEGLADIVTAQTEMQRRLALEHAAGGVSRLYDEWTRRLTHARAMIEAELDFADEEDVPGTIGQTIREDLRALCAELAQHLRGARAGEIIRDGLTVVITGPPNVGKSSLINYLAGRDIAIVTDIPGTTRDIISVDLDLDGFAVRVLDTAGIRDTAEVVELEGIRRARTAVANADLILRLVDNSERVATVVNDAAVLEDSKAPTIYIAPKSDLGEEAPRADGSGNMIPISTRTGAGMDALFDAIRQHLPRLTDAAAFAIPSRERHNDALRTALHSIEDALAVDAESLELQAESLRLAANAIGRITGRVDVENLLDVIFSEFCIGK